jgi:hypothetical protein
MDVSIANDIDHDLDIRVFSFETIQQIAQDIPFDAVVLPRIRNSTLFWAWSEAAGSASATITAASTHDRHRHIRGGQNADVRPRR